MPGMIYSQLLNYGACDVADALVKNGISTGGYVPHLIRQSPGTCSVMVGPAYTVLYAPIDDPRPALNSHYIDNAPADSIVVIATDPTVQLDGAPYTRIVNALYGGLMSTRANYLGCKGSVVLGKIRDIDEHRSLNYPVFSYGLGISAPTKVAKVVAVDVPIQVVSAASVIYPGDIVVGDENGVAVIPRELIANVVRDIPPKVKADQLAAEDIKNGIPAELAQKTRRKNL
jgi:regulator of RNase E activity RraA